MAKKKRTRKVFVKANPEDLKKQLKSYRKTIDELEQQIGEIEEFSNGKSVECEGMRSFDDVAILLERAHVGLFKTLRKLKRNS